jgi:hypothetical protein
MITKEALRIAHEKAIFIGTVNRQFDDNFGVEGAKVGNTLRIRLPAQYVRTTGSRVMDIQDSEEQKTTVVMSKQDHVDMRFNSAELFTDIDDFSERKIQPAMSVLMSGVDGDFLQAMTKLTPSLAGTPGSPPTDLAAIGAARAKLNQGLAPKDGNRNVMLDSVTMGGLVNGLKGLFQDSAQIKEQYREGKIGRTGMADWYENDRAYTQANSAGTATVTANDTITDNKTTLTVNTTTTAWAVGSVFTIATVFDCHPETKVNFSNLKQFTVTAATATVLTISPTIFITGPKQNVTQSTGVAFPSGTALSGNVSLSGSASTSYVHNLMYHRDAYTFVTGSLPLMAGADRCVRKTFDGISLRVWTDSDIRNDEQLTRIDILYGFAAIRPQWGCRITS